jgi:hypothetical protein
MMDLTSHSGCKLCNISIADRLDRSGLKMQTKQLLGRNGRPAEDMTRGVLRPSIGSLHSSEAFWPPSIFP